MKKGYMLTETMVAIAIILIITFSFYSLASFATISSQKSIIIANGINEINNVIKLANQSSFKDNNNFSITDFKNKLYWKYDGKPINFTANENTYTFNFTTNTNYEYSENGIGNYVFTLQYKNQSIKLDGKIYFKDKLLYEMPTSFEKVVI